MLFDGSEPRFALYSSLISHFRRFLKKSKNRCQKGPEKSCFLIQNRSLDAPGSIDSAIWVVFGRFEKTLVFGCRTRVSKKMRKINFECVLVPIAGFGSSRCGGRGEGREGGYRIYTNGNWI